MLKLTFNCDQATVWGTSFVAKTSELDVGDDITVMATIQNTLGTFELSETFCGPEDEMDFLPDVYFRFTYDLAPGENIVTLRSYGTQDWKPYEYSAIGGAANEYLTEIFFSDSDLASFTLNKTYMLEDADNIRKISGNLYGSTHLSITANCFENHPNLEEFSLRNVYYIGDSAFKNCQLLRYVVIDVIYSIWGTAFDNCTNIVSVEYYPNYSSVSTGILKDCNKLTYLQMVTYTSPIAFIYGTIRYHGNTHTLPPFFSGRKDLYLVDNVEGWDIIPSSITVIGTNAFKNCSNLKLGNITDNITTIEANAFNGCSSLTDFYLPETLTTIGANAFDGCSSLERFHDTGWWYDEDTYEYLEEETDHSWWSGGVENAPDHLNIDTVEDKLTDTIIYSNALNNHTPIILYNYYLNGQFILNNDYTIPSEVSDIGNGCFTNNTNLQKVSILNTVNKVGSKIFVGCTNLTDVYVRCKSSSFKADSKAKGWWANSGISINTLKVHGILSAQQANSAYGSYWLYAYTLGQASGVITDYDMVDYYYTYIQDLSDYTISNNLINCSLTNNATQINEGQSYTSYINLSGRCNILDNVKILSDTTDITNNVYDSINHSIYIPSVEGDITINGQGYYTGMSISPFFANRHKFLTLNFPLSWTDINVPRTVDNTTGRYWYEYPSFAMPENNEYPFTWSFLDYDNRNYVGTGTLIANGQSQQFLLENQSGGTGTSIYINMNTGNKVGNNYTRIVITAPSDWRYNINNCYLTGFTIGED